jgi:Trypsin-like peptidase domain
MLGVLKSTPLWIALVCLIPQKLLAKQGPSAEVMTTISHSVVQVISRNCDGVEASRTGSGFLWGNSQQIVTALHVVAGCKTIAAYFEGRGELGIRPIRQLKEADLVLMQLARNVSAPALSQGSVTPTPNERLQAIGFYYGVPTLDNRSVTVTIGSSTLQDMLTDTLRDTIKRAGSPELSVHIIRLDGHLLPGLSGAPVINSAGQVVGIGSGGLADGAAGVSWAIAASYLTQLANAPVFQQNDPGPPHNPAFFSTGEGFTARSLKCGELDFVPIRHNTVAQLAPSSDNPIGLIQIASTTGLSSDKLSAIPLDSYVNPGSGGSFALPSGAVLESDNGMCRVSLANGKYVIWIASARVDSPIQTQQVTVDWELSWSKRAPFTWVANPYFSYWAPYSRPLDGLTINRKTFAGYNGLAPVAEAFETLMARGNTAIGVVVVNRQFNPPLYQQCLSEPGLAGCNQVNADYLQWTASLFGTFLSTFPPR